MGRKHKKKRGRNRGGGPRNRKLNRLLDQLSEHTPIQPEDRIRLETGSGDKTGRIIDLIAPLGKGQRVMIPSPPKAGKTTILQKIAKAVDKNHPEIDQIGLLVDERSEEVTDFKRNIPIRVEASSIDRPPTDHVKRSEHVFAMALEKLYAGKDVLILLDSLTRMARAYNKTYKGSGRTLSGGITAGALDRPRQMFGTARNFESGGSLTIVASALVETGSRMDEVIFQEFKGTGNSELVLDRALAQRRLWPAVNVNESGTRQEMRLLDEIEERQIPKLRRQLANRSKIDALEWLLGRIKRTDNNKELLGSVT